MKQERIFNHINKRCCCCCCRCHRNPGPNLLDQAHGLKYIKFKLFIPYASDAILTPSERTDTDPSSPSPVGAVPSNRVQRPRTRRMPRWCCPSSALQLSCASNRNGMERTGTTRKRTNPFLIHPAQALSTPVGRSYIAAFR